MEVEENATVKKLKREIASKESLEEQRMVLMHENGRLIRDDQRGLTESGVVNGSIIYLFFSCASDCSWLTYFEDFVTFLLKEP